MDNVVQVECISCGAKMSGVRTEFGSLVVPGREECPRCGSAELAEAAGVGETRAEAEPGTDAATE